jgi:hypothetical protein
VTLFAFLSGAVTFAFLVAALYFLRFWRRTADLLFAAFAGAFALLGLNQALLVLINVPAEERSWVYILRIAAFVLILAAIAQKNRGSRPAGGGED